MTAPDLFAAAKAFVLTQLDLERARPEFSCEQLRAVQSTFTDLIAAIAHHEERMKRLAADCAEDPQSAAEVVMDQERRIAALEAELAKAREQRLAFDNSLQACRLVISLGQAVPTRESVLGMIDDVLGHAAPQQETEK